MGKLLLWQDLVTASLTGCIVTRLLPVPSGGYECKQMSDSVSEQGFVEHYCTCCRRRGPSDCWHKAGEKGTTVTVVCAVADFPLISDAPAQPLLSQPEMPVLCFSACG